MSWFWNQPKWPVLDEDRRSRSHDGGSNFSCCSSSLLRIVWSFSCCTDFLGPICIFLVNHFGLISKYLLSVAGLLGAVLHLLSVRFLMDVP